MADTGNTATLVLSGGFTANLYVIGATNQQGEDIEDSHLGTTEKKTFIPGDLYDAGEFECEFEWKPSNPLPPMLTVQTATITFPVPAGLSSGGTLAGTAYIKSRSTPELRNNTLMAGKFTVKWDGKTGPVYTNAS